MPQVSNTDWDAFLSGYPDAHILQSALWGELKSSFGWEVSRVVVGATGGQILFRRYPFGFQFAYIPKGPVGAFTEAFWQEVDQLCKRRRVFLLKVEPDTWAEASTSLQPQLPSLAFRLSSHSIQPMRTLVLDIRGSEAEILEKMKQKTRYNIRLALKRGIVVRPSADLDTFYRMLQATSRRDGFGIHQPGYYQKIYELFSPRNECELLQAEYQGQPLAALLVLARGKRAWYFYGASSNEHRDWMPTYLLQWEAIRWARRMGCSEYDLWGVPDFDEEKLEANFSTRSDGLWGVYRFKRGFGGTLRRAAGPWDRVYNPWLYAIYRLWISRYAYERPPV